MSSADCQHNDAPVAAVPTGSIRPVENARLLNRMIRPRRRPLICSLLVQCVQLGVYQMFSVLLLAGGVALSIAVVGIILIGLTFASLRE